MPSSLNIFQIKTTPLKHCNISIISEKVINYNWINEGQNTKWLAYLFPDTAAPGSNHSSSVFLEKILNFGELIVSSVLLRGSVDKAKKLYSWSNPSSANCTTNKKIQLNKDYLHFDAVKN